MLGLLGFIMMAAGLCLVVVVYAKNLSRCQCEIKRLRPNGHQWVCRNCGRRP